MKKAVRTKNLQKSFSIASRKEDFFSVDWIKSLTQCLIDQEFIYISQPIIICSLLVLQDAQPILTKHFSCNIGKWEKIKICE